VRRLPRWRRPQLSTTLPRTYLIHSVTIHVKYRDGLLPKRASFWPAYGHSRRFAACFRARSPVAANGAHVFEKRVELRGLESLAFWMQTTGTVLLAVKQCSLQGWPASFRAGSGLGPWFLTGVSAETPGASMTSRVRSPGTFHARCPGAVTVTLEAGGAGTYIERAIPDLRPHQGLWLYPNIMGC